MQQKYKSKKNILIKTILINQNSIKIKMKNQNTCRTVSEYIPNI